MLVFRARGFPGYELSDFALCWPDSLSLDLILTSVSSSLQLNRVNGTSSPQSPLSTSGRVAAVGPYIQVPSTGGFPLPGDPVKPQSLTIASGAAHGRSKSGKLPQFSPGEHRRNMWAVVNPGFLPPEVPAVCNNNDPKTRTNDLS